MLTTIERIQADRKPSVRQPDERRSGPPNGRPLKGQRARPCAAQPPVPTRHRALARMPSAIRQAPQDACISKHACWRSAAVPHHAYGYVGERNGAVAGIPVDERLSCERPAGTLATDQGPIDTHINPYVRAVEGSRPRRCSRSDRSVVPDEPSSVMPTNSLRADTAGKAPAVPRAGRPAAGSPCRACRAD